MAASATTTTREVGTVLGVAALGSLFNNRLIDYLTQRLIELEVPPEFRDIVITAVLTGQVSGAEEAEKLYGPIVAKVVDAAYDAVHSGVSFSLFVAGCVILLSGWSPGSRSPRGEWNWSDGRRPLPPRHRRRGRAGGTAPLRRPAQTRAVSAAPKPEPASGPDRVALRSVVGACRRLEMPGPGRPMPGRKPCLECRSDPRRRSVPSWAR